MQFYARLRFGAWKFHRRHSPHTMRRTTASPSAMSYATGPKTDPGAHLLLAIESVVPRLQERAAQADRESALCQENFADLQAAGVASAWVPSELGGLGLQSVHDWILAIAALAKGDGSTAIAMNMHLAVSAGMAVAYRRAGSKADGLAAGLSAMARGEMLVCATATEAGSDNLHPFTEATRTAGGWRIDGTKLFATLSPVATHIAMNLKVCDDDGEHIGTALLPMATPGIQPQNDWDALGMRGSGSQSIRFDNVEVSESTVRRLGPWGVWSIPVLLNRTMANLPLVGAFLGMAEAAYEIAVANVNQRQKLGKAMNREPGVQHVVGEMTMELARCQSIMRQAGLVMDAFLERSRDTAPTLAAAHEIMQDYQAAKWTVNRGAIKIVGQAMDLAGGAAFMSSHPLSRLYRDVRAGPFMQPYSPPEAREYVGKVALGLLPED